MLRIEVLKVASQKRVVLTNINAIISRDGFLWTKSMGIKLAFNSIASLSRHWIDNNSRHFAPRGSGK